ncbi:MAG: hypothetical protein IBX50_16365 [Marinospirillum sp.]|uniref:hypothetical protein n=1 Tax=Marinospirillum sp. TaxID=2183934 RepID=UPI0019D80E1B|nr:hypothetical protein [Marinospirillum sp.]MBE0508264.1 hypothetical protein [Marinospirillum sp.]
MVLSPLAVVLLAQLGVLLFGIIFFQKLQKRRLIKEMDALKSSGTHHQAPKLSASDDGFDRPQAELLLNRLYQSSLDITSEAPAARDECRNQQQLLHALAECLDIEMNQPASKTAPSAEAPVAAAAATATAATATERPEAPVIEPYEESEILSQEELDQALGETDGLEEFNLDDFEELETSDNADQEDDIPLPGEEPELPEDTLQATLDNLDDFDFSDLEEELLKDDDKK